MIDLGDLNYCLGISSTCTTDGLFLYQQKYANEIVDRTSIVTPYSESFSNSGL